MSALTAIELREMSTMLKAFFEKEYMEKIYPVGAIYLSVNDTDPSSLFGGTWERLKDRFLLGAGDVYTAGSDGGSATHTHSIDNIWADIYMVANDTSYRPQGVMMMKQKEHDGIWANMDYVLQDNGSLKRNATSGGGSVVARYGTNIDGNLGDGNNIPPYLTVYMWKRTA